MKEKILRVRIDDYTDEKLKTLEADYGLTRSEIVRRSLDIFETGKINDLFGVDMLKMLLPFKGAYNLKDFGIVGNDYLRGKGFWLILTTNFQIGLTKGFEYGGTQIKFNGNTVKVNGGFLNDIQKGLEILYSSKRER